MNDDITKYWSIPDGKIEISRNRIKHTNKTLNNISNFRIIIFESVDDFQKNMHFINENYKGVVVIIGNILDFSSIFNHIYFKHFERLIAYRIEGNNSHHLHNYLLILNYNDEKRPYREIREKYTYCPTCNQTSKDYGGKKHHYPSDGTWIRDVWNKIYFKEDIINDPLFLDAIINLYGTHESYNTLVVRSTNKVEYSIVDNRKKIIPSKLKTTLEKRDIIIHKNFNQTIINGDCFNVFPYLVNEGYKFDLIFVDPPYNLNKKYKGYRDSKSIDEYTDWCIEWGKAVYPLLKKDGIFVILNTPMNILLQLPSLIKYYHYIEDIVWDDLAVPATGKMQPTNYTLLFLSKSQMNIKPKLYRLREPIFCKRKGCITKEESYRNGMSIWSDIHRTRQKSRRWGHPCNLPEELIERIIGIAQEIQNKNNIQVLDFFNGVGTTTMAALKQNSISVGIELSRAYFKIQKERLDKKLYFNPEAEKKYRAPKRNKKFLQNLVARVLTDNDRIDKGFSTDEQIEWLMKNSVLNKSDLEIFSRNGELLRSVGKGGVPGKDKLRQSTVHKFSIK